MTKPSKYALDEKQDGLLRAIIGYERGNNQFKMCGMFWKMVYRNAMYRVFLADVLTHATTLH